MFQIWRIFHQPLHQDERENSDRNVDVKDPVPAVIVGQPAANRWAYRWCQHGNNAVERERQAALAGLERVRHDGLRHRWSPPPPAPWITRKSSNNPSDGASPHRKEAAVKITMQSRKKFLRPITLDAHPPIGNTTAFATRYVVNTQVLSSRLAPSPPAMYGSATFAMEVSSTSMKAAIATVTAITHGFVFGFHIAVGTAAAAAAISLLSSLPDGLVVAQEQGRAVRPSLSYLLNRCKTRVRRLAD